MSCSKTERPALSANHLRSRAVDLIPMIGRHPSSSWTFLVFKVHTQFEFASPCSPKAANGSGTPLLVRMVL